MGWPGCSASASISKTAIHYHFTGLWQGARAGQTASSSGFQESGSALADLFRHTTTISAVGAAIGGIGIHITGPHFVGGCNVNECLAQVQQDLGACLFQCPVVYDPFTGKYRQDWVCVNTCKLGARSDSNACNTTGCRIGKICCWDWSMLGTYGTCSDLTTDVSNCGQCFKACAGLKPACCWGTCKDLSNDPQNCDRCGDVCKGGKVCTVFPYIHGVVFSRCICPQGLTDCNGTCRDLKTDLQNCGKCGNACTDGKFCQQGFCRCPDNAPWDCSGTCVNRLTDDNNCGGCGKKCSSTEKCCNGTCTPFNTTQNCGAGECNHRCPAGQSCCRGGPAQFSCTDTKSDRANCGGCDQPCRSGYTCCQGACKDLQHDAQNCGVCNGQCPSGMSCLEGVCCANGYGNCGGVCTPLNTTANCGSCGNFCAQGASCVNGNCVCQGPPGVPMGVCGGVCTQLNTTTNCGSCRNSCPKGGACSNGVCVCPGGARCPFTNQCCPTQNQCAPGSGCCPSGCFGCLNTGGHDPVCGPGCCPSGYTCCSDSSTGCCPPCPSGSEAICSTPQGTCVC